MNTLLDRIAHIAERESITIGKLERTIGASKGVISRAIQNGTDIQAKWITKLVENYPQYSPRWLITGEGECLIASEGSIHKVDNIAENLNDPLSHGKILPLIPYDAFAGYGEFTYGDMPIENYYTINEFNTADFLIRVKGDSMYPKYNSGDLIACKKVNEITFWQWHRIYAICTKNQGILIKRVEEFRENPAYITLVSENPKYKPFEIHEDEIIDVALVLGAIILE